MRISHPPAIHKKIASPQAAAVPIFRVLMRFWLPMRPGGLPYAGAVPMPDAFPHTFSADHPYHTQAPKIRLQSRRDQRSGSRRSSANPIHSNALNLRNTSADPRVQPVYSNPPGAWAWRRLAMRRRRRRSGSLRSGRPEGRRLRPRAWIPEESGQVGFSKSPQMWRRIAQDG